MEKANYNSEKSSFVSTHDTSRIVFGTSASYVMEFSGVTTVKFLS